MASSVSLDQDPCAGCFKAGACRSLLLGRRQASRVPRACVRAQQIYAAMQTALQNTAQLGDTMMASIRLLQNPSNLDHERIKVIERVLSRMQTLLHSAQALAEETRQSTDPGQVLHNISAMSLLQREVNSLARQAS